MRAGGGRLCTTNALGHMPRPRPPPGFAAPPATGSPWLTQSPSPPTYPSSFTTQPCRDSTRPFAWAGTDFAGAIAKHGGVDLYLNGHAHTLTQYTIDGGV